MVSIEKTDLALLTVIVIVGVLLAWQLYGPNMFSIGELRDRAFHVLHADAVDGVVEERSVSDWFVKRNDTPAQILSYPIFTATIVSVLSTLFLSSVSGVFLLLLGTVTFVLLPFLVFYLTLLFTRSKVISWLCTGLFVIGSWTQKYFWMGTLPQALITSFTLLFLIALYKKKEELLPFILFLTSITHRYGVYLGMLCATLYFSRYMARLWKTRKANWRTVTIICLNFMVLIIGGVIQTSLSGGLAETIPVKGVDGFGMMFIRNFFVMHNWFGWWLFIFIALAGFIGLTLLGTNRKGLELVFLLLASFGTWWLDTNGRSTYLGITLWFVCLGEFFLFLRGFLRHKLLESKFFAEIREKLRNTNTYIL